MTITRRKPWLTRDSKLTKSMMKILFLNNIFIEEFITGWQNDYIYYNEKVEYTFYTVETHITTERFRGAHVTAKFLNECAELILLDKSISNTDMEQINKIYNMLENDLKLRITDQIMKKFKKSLDID